MGEPSHPPNPVCAAFPASVTNAADEGALADSRLAGDEDQPAMTGTGLRQVCGDRPQLGLALEHAHVGDATSTAAAGGSWSSSGSQPGQQGVDDVVREHRLERFPAQQQPVVHRTEEQLVHEGDVRTRAQVARATPRSSTLATSPRRSITTSSRNAWER